MTPTVAVPLKAPETVLNFDFGPLFEIVDGTPADAQIPRRAGFAKAVERAADVTQAQARGDGDGVERDAVAVDRFRADEPAGIAGIRVLEAARPA